MNQNIKIGNCGFGRTKRPEYVALFPVVEIQHTFYDPPQLKTLENWRSAVPDDFEFTLKAWQMITHEASSPTYRRLKRPLTEKETAEAGFFRPTETVQNAWEITLASARALKAKTVLFQCPARFQPLPENILDMISFFSNIERGGLNLAWELRGKLWDDSVVKDLCLKLDLWHCVDPFSHPTVTPDKCYYRLHGTPRWRYTYEEGELIELATLLPSERSSYVFFNNITMKNDALRFQNIVRDQQVNL